MKTFIIVLCLWVLLCSGCTTRNIDGSPDRDSTWAHYLLPGYTTYDALHDRRESILVDNALNHFPSGTAYSEQDFKAILHDPMRVGIDIPTLWDAVVQGNYHLVLSLLWDAVKGAAWIYGINELSSSSSSSGDSVNIGVPDVGSSITILGSRNNVTSKVNPDSSSVVVLGDFNVVSTVGFPRD